MNTFRLICTSARLVFRLADSTKGRAQSSRSAAAETCFNSSPTLPPKPSTLLSFQPYGPALAHAYLHLLLLPPTTQRKTHCTTTVCRWNEAQLHFAVQSSRGMLTTVFHEVSVEMKTLRYRRLVF
ncbi:hypothetical protein HZH68_001690 [Vespula germanica]|uniref:Uncharacterized protein n=1 Tax=Vespula germanica TaxID=30212 RepID=A0A834NW77_VESGE|nr:hypothetical protein HZH68_001690 [Vespula germanica]